MHNTTATEEHHACWPRRYGRRRGDSMSAGEWLTVVSIVSALAVTIVGGVIRWLVNQNAELRREKETQRLAYETKLEIAERALETKSEIVDELRRQVDRLTITAEIQDKLFKQLPSPPPRSGER